jgi:hypothetical protein
VTCVVWTSRGAHQAGEDRLTLFRLGRVIGERPPGLRLIIPFVVVLHRISLGIVTMLVAQQTAAFDPGDPSTPTSIPEWDTGMVISPSQL